MATEPARVPAPQPNSTPAPAPSRRAASPVAAPRLRAVALRADQPAVRLTAGGAGPAGRPAQIKFAPAARDPRFQQTLRRLDTSAARAGSHPPAAKKAADAQAAALPPANERLAGAKAGSVEAMQAAETGKPENTSFLDMLRVEIQKVMPKKTEDADEFMQGDDKNRLKGAMTGNISQQKAQATGAVHAASTTPPDPSRVPGKEVTPLPDDRPPAPTAIDAGSAMPAPQPPAAVSLQQGKQDADRAIKDAELTTPQLKKANDPRFSAVITAKADVDTKADSLPQQFRVGEQRTIADAVVKAQVDERKGVGALAGQQQHSGAAVHARQLTAKQKDEQERKKVADTIEQHYAETKQAVDKKLESLDQEVERVFDAGTEAAIQKMKDYVETRFDDRYSGISGKALWLKDKIRPLPAKVKVWFDEAHAVFLAEMDALVVRVANLVETRLREAKDEIRKGERRIADYVKGLPANLQSVGKAAQQEMSGRFAELRRGVDDKKADLAEKLAQRYKDAYEKGATALQDLKDAHKSLIEKLKEFVEKVVKVLREFKDRIVSMLKKAGDTLSLIISDPIGFLGNLLSAIKQGISQFVDRIWVHLKEGFMEWLFGSLAEAGITVPKDFSLPAIFQMVLAVLGLTYDKIRAKVAKQIGERNVGLIERAAVLLKELVTGGPARLWEMVKESFANLKEMLTGEILTWLIGEIVKAAVTKLISMFNPVGAIIQAILMIYRTVMFFIERINQILDFVQAIIESVSKIAHGDIGGAANWIEQALARAIPLIIAFLARLLGISGITDRIKRIIHKLQSKVDQAIDKVVEKVVGMVRGVLGGGAKDERTPQQKQADLNRAVQAAKALDPRMSRVRKFIELRRIKQQYGLTELAATPAHGKLIVHAAVNPELSFEIDDVSSLSAASQAALDRARARITTLGHSASMEHARKIVLEEIHKDDPHAQISFEPDRSLRLGALNIFTRTSSAPPQLIGIILDAAHVYRTVEVRGNQRAVVSVTSSLQRVLTNKGTYIQRYVWRAISADDRRRLDQSELQMERGQRQTRADLIPRSTVPPARLSDAVVKHVLNKALPSNFISMTTVAEANISNRLTDEQFNSLGYIKIDLLHISPDRIIDISTAARATEWGLASPKFNQQGYLDALHTREVLIQGELPGEAIVAYKPKN